MAGPVKRRCCIRCDAPLESRTQTIDKQVFTVWVRVCGCQTVTGCGWHWRKEPEPIDLDDDNIPAWSDVPA